MACRQATACQCFADYIIVLHAAGKRHSALPHRSTLHSFAKAAHSIAQPARCKCVSVIVMTQHLSNLYPSSCGHLRQTLLYYASTEFLNHPESMDICSDLSNSCIRCNTKICRICPVDIHGQDLQHESSLQMLGDVFSALTAAVGAADKVVELIQRKPALNVCIVPADGG